METMHKLLTETDYNRKPAQGVVYVLALCELHVGRIGHLHHWIDLGRPGNPRVFAKLASAIDWARLDGSFDEWQQMRWHVVDTPEGYLAKFESDFVVDQGRAFYEIFEISLE